MTPSLSFAAPEFAWIACAALVLITWLSLVGSRSSIGGRVRTAVLLRLMGVLLIVTCLLEPVWSSTRAIPDANELVILVDDSASMNSTFAEDGRSAADLARALVSGSDVAWINELRQAYRVSFRKLSDGSPVDPAAPLSFPDSQAIDVASTLRRVAAIQRGTRTGGVLLITDGRLSTGVKVEADDLPPLFPVLLPVAEAIPDLAINSVKVSATGFESTPIEVSARVRRRGKVIHATVALYAGDSLDPVDEQSLTFHPREQSREVRFLSEDAIGAVSHYRVEVATEDVDEAVIANNVGAAAAPAAPVQRRVLYVSGRPNWEHKFLSRALSEHQSLRLTSLIRVAKGEARFDWRGRDDRVQQALRRDAGRQTESEPVFLRLGLLNDDELADGFPTELAALSAFDAVIVDDLEPGFFSAAQIDLLRRYVIDQGGGLLWLGGREAFTAEGLRSGLAELWPFEVTGRSAPEASLDFDDATFRYRLTPEGELASWLRTLPDANANEQADARLAPLRTVNLVGRPKLSARVLAAASTPDGSRRPLLVTQRRGLGTVAACCAGDLWRWQLGTASEAESRSALPRRWRQVVDWLVSDVPAPIEIQIDPDRTSRPVSLTVRNGEREPDTTHPPRVTCERLGEAAEPIRVQRDSDAPGLYHCCWTPDEPGTYRIRVVREVTDEPDVAREAVFVWNPVRREHQSRVATAAYEHLAGKSGGRLVTTSELASLADELKASPQILREPVRTALWHHWTVFTLAMACLIGSWWLRRRHGLA